jgi:retinol dehydrogenase-12
MATPPLKTAVVTGATSGIGRWIAMGLAAAGHRVIMVGRNRERGEATQAWIAARVPGAQTQLHITDLSSLAETRALGAAILRDMPTLDLLVNNAGALCPRRVVTAEGHETTVATNLLSPILLTQTLLPALQAAPRARVVMIGSSSSDRAEIDPENLELTHGWSMVRAYAQSKLALMIESFALAERLRHTTVTVNVVHPGLVATRIVRHGGVAGLAWRLMAPFSLSEERGAAPPLFACLSPELDGRTGIYIKRRSQARPNHRALDPELVARVDKETALLLSRSV